MYRHGGPAAIIACDHTVRRAYLGYLLIAASAVLLSVSQAFGLADFSGTWVLDIRSSGSPDPILKRLGASWVERQFGGSLQLEATYAQTPNSLTVRLRGIGFRRTDVLRIDNKPEIQEDSTLGQYTIRTFWSGNGRNSLQPFLFAPRIQRMPKWLLFAN
jgi:hypothetical protein